MDNDISLVTGAKKNNHYLDDKNNLDICIQNFSTNVLDNLDSIPKIRDNLVQLSNTGKIAANYIRPTAWKIFLDVLPSNQNNTLENWVNTVIEQRKIYKKKIKSLNCLKKLSGDPLGGEKETGWNSFFEDSEIKKIINLDVNRTFQDKDLFCTTFVKDLLCNILFLWAKENKDPCYKQGMNEILAMFVYSLYPFYFKNPYDKEQKTNKMQSYLEDPKKYQKELYLFFHDEGEFQSDLYFLFTNIMKHGAARFFENAKLEDVKIQGNCETYLSKRCGVIIHEKLQLYDKNLYDHFVKIDLDCQIFLQRWIKCIFNREFHPRDVEVIWDGILSTEKKSQYTELQMIDYISVGMIVFIKKDLIGKDQNDSFQRLFKYPPIESPLTLIQLGHTILSKNEEKIKGGFKIEPKKKPVPEEPKTTSPVKKIQKPKDNQNTTNTIISEPISNGNSVNLSNKQLIDELELLFKKYQFAMEIPDIGNYQVFIETLRNNILKNKNS